MAEVEVARAPPAKTRPAHPRHAATKSQIDFVKKLRHLQQSDPVDPKELSRRLELFLVEQEVLARRGIERQIKRVRRSSSASRSSSKPPSPKPKIKARPLSLTAEALARSLEFHRANNGTNPSDLSTGSVSKKGNATSPSPPSVDQGRTSLPRQVPDQSIKEAPKGSHHRRSISALSRTLGPASSQPRASQELVCDEQKSEKLRSRPKSIPFMPHNAASQLVRTATPKAVKRENVHVLSQPVLDAYNRPPSIPAPQPSPLPILEPLSPLDTSFGENTLLFGQLSSAARSSFASTSTAPCYTTAPTSPAFPSQAPSSQTTTSPPLTVTPKLDKRRSWHPRTIVASIRLRNEANDRRVERNNFQLSSTLLDATRSDRRIQGPPSVAVNPAESEADGHGKKMGGKRVRPKSTAFENFTTSKSTTDLSKASIKPSEVPVPILVLPGQAQRTDWSQHEYDDSEKESLWRRRTRRRTLGAEDVGQDKESKESLRTMPSAEHLRWKQLAMREKAVTASRNAKGSKSTLEKSPVHQVSLQSQQPQIMQQGSPPKMPLPLPPKRTSSKMPLQPQKQSQPEPEAQVSKNHLPQQAEGAVIDPRSPQIDSQRESTNVSTNVPHPKRTTSLKSRSHSVAALQNAPSQTPPPPIKQEQVIAKTPAESQSTAATSKTRSRINTITVDTEIKVVGEGLPADVAARNFGARNYVGPEASVASRKVKGPQRSSESPQHIRSKSAPKIGPPRPTRLSSLPPPPPKETPPPIYQPTAYQRPQSRGHHSTSSPSIDRPRSRPILGQDNQPVPYQPALRSRSSSITLRPKSAGGTRTPGVAPEVPDFEIRSMTPDSVRLLRSQEIMLRHRAGFRITSAKSTGALNSALNSPPWGGSPESTRRGSRNLMSEFNSMDLSRHPECNGEEIPGMTPESMRLLKEQERILSERMGKPLRSCSVPYLSTETNPDSAGTGKMVLLAKEKKKWKKERWWKVWRLV